MKKFGVYKILHEKPLMVEYYRGIISMEDLIHLKKIIIKEPNYNYNSNTIIDFRDCELKIDLEDLIKLINFFKTNFKTKKERKIVYIVSQTNSVVLASLFSFLATSKSLNFNTNVYTNVESAVKFFGKEIITKKDYTSIIHELKTSPNNVFTE